MDLCIEYADAQPESVRQELVRRKMFSPDEWRLIKTKKVKIGMSELALVCSWGMTERNRSVLASGVHTQYVYDKSYVYVNGRQVTSFQEWPVGAESNCPRM